MYAAAGRLEHGRRVARVLALLVEGDHPVGDGRGELSGDRGELGLVAR